MARKTSGKRSFVVMIIGLFLLVLLSFIHLTQGQADYTVTQLVKEVWTEGRVQDIVLSLRLPRLIIGILAGGALAVAGAVLQTLTNNPLASAGTLGINAGAYFFVVVSMIFFPSLLGNFPFIVALVGAVLSSVLVVMLAGKQMEPVRVALTGMIISLLFASMTGSLQLLFENQTNGLFLWGSGTLVQLNWDGVSFAGPVIIVFFILALVLTKPLDTLSLGEDIASSLGQNVRFVKLLRVGCCNCTCSYNGKCCRPNRFYRINGSAYCSDAWRSRAFEHSPPVIFMGKCHADRSRCVRAIDSTRTRSSSRCNDRVDWWTMAVVLGMENCKNA